ncbi:TIGR00341 family protein [Sediminibacterium roseum]|uniref:TIGR00341 family protein n=1 Tax=Sediminibacterium roseum TaxID=1978412 RepID=A0ABW9ZYP8_9BACT|nr:TIGR00341 family protein [Sediminibacterium roseum]NCI50318.1 TIGR00341 family protein [Sediminibacterium roseum]
MKNRLLDTFSLHYEKEEYETVVATISRGVVFRGTNLWILIFAIFVASLGLNVNSTAVIIGAMLISPLMGPIMGIGLSLGINDIPLLRKSIYNFLVATLVALVTSTVFFLISPLNDAHSEILARTSPTIYDVLIALFGGLAGIIATSTKQKGNVIPGVAIATALMPPLCTAGYGLATFRFSFFFGSFYLFVINTVFIALATLLTVRLLQFPHSPIKEGSTGKMARRITWIVVVITLLPSVYFGYDMVQRNRFEKEAARFITAEAHFTNDYLLSKKIDAKNKSIVLVFGGKEISPLEIGMIEMQLQKYDLKNAKLEIKQGFAYLAETQGVKQDAQLTLLTQALEEKEKNQQALQIQLDSVKNNRALSEKLFAELKTQYNSIKSAIIEPSVIHTSDSTDQRTFLVLLTTSTGLSKPAQKKIESWLRVRLDGRPVSLVVKQQVQL